MNRFLEDRFDELTCADGVKRPIHIWEAGEAKGVLVAIHGGMSHAGNYCVMADAFRRKSWNMVSFDMRGHINKEVVHFDRIDDMLDDLKLFVQWVKAQYPGLPIFMVGHSMGGLFAALYGLKRETPEDEIIGYVMSAPYWENAIKVSPVLKALSGMLSAIVPKMVAPKEDFGHVLTHDPEINERIKVDQADFTRGSQITVRGANELLKAHKEINQIIDRWNKPLFVAVAGEDRLTDSDKLVELLARIDGQFVEQHLYPDNYHENFNELNREEIFNQIEDWLGRRI